MKLPAAPGSLFARSFLRWSACLLLAMGVLSSLRVNAEESRENRFDAVIRSAALKHGLDPLLLKALIWHESRFNPLATGKAGEIGLMQLRMIVVRDWAQSTGVPAPSEHEVYDPYLNLEIGSWYLARAMKRWQESSFSLLLALGEYNAGRARVLGWIRKNEGDSEKAIAQSASAGYVRSIRGKYMEYLLAVMEPDFQEPGTLEIAVQQPVI